MSEAEKERDVTVGISRKTREKLIEIAKAEHRNYKGQITFMINERYKKLFTSKKNK